MSFTAFTAPRKSSRPFAVFLGTLLALTLVSSPAAAKGKDLKCPRGTELRGKRPPDGRKQWCARSGGAQHGPSVRYYKSGKKMVRAQFEDGKMNGTYEAWH